MPRVKQKLMDLNDDELMSIFEHLSLFDLMSLVEVNKRANNAAEAVIKQKLKQKQLALHGPYEQKEIYNSINNEYSDRIDIGSMSFMSHFLKRFGHLVYDVQIFPFDSSVSKVRPFYQLVNSYCARTLFKLHIRNLEDDSVLDEFKSPFNTVEEIKIWGEFDHLNNLNFSKVFPAISKLQISTRIFNHVKLIEHMPKLKHFSFVNWFEQTTDSIKQFIQKNRQIESLKMTGISPNLLGFIADELNLKYLSLSNYDNVNYDSDIHFEHLRSLKIMTYPMPKNISFGQVLEEFECVVCNEYADRLVEMIQSHKSTLKVHRLVIYVEDHGER